LDDTRRKIKPNLILSNKKNGVIASYSEALEEAEIALENFSGPNVEPQIAPCAMFEKGNALRLLGKKKEAKECFINARDNYTGYYYRNRLHFRCHNFLKLIENK